MSDALTQLYEMIALSKPGDTPKILVKIELVGGAVQYHPPIDKQSADVSVQVKHCYFRNPRFAAGLRPAAALRAGLRNLTSRNSDFLLGTIL